MFWDFLMETSLIGEFPLEIAIISSTKVGVELNHTITERNLGEIWLTIMLDTYLRSVLSYHITIGQPSNRSNIMVLNECVRRYNRLPMTIVTDQGRDFTGGFYKLLKRYGVIMVCRSPHQAQFSSLVERCLASVTSQTFHNLKGNTEIIRNSSMDTKATKPLDNRVWTLPALNALFKEYFYESYDTTKHS